MTERYGTFEYGDPPPKRRGFPLASMGAGLLSLLLTSVVMRSCKSEISHGEIPGGGEYQTVAFFGAAACALFAIVAGIVGLARSRSGHDRGFAAFASIAGFLSAGASLAGLALALVFGSLFGFIFALGSGGGPGRLFRIGGRACTASLRAHGEWSRGARADVSTLDPATRAHLAERYRDDASLEHASVAAFARLSLDLMALGAPPELIERVHAAAQDEINHARLSFALASAYAGEEVGPGSFPAAVVHDESRGNVAALARETLIDGCLGESFAARVAEEGLRGAKDPAVRDALAIIAHDEERHAELAWSILRFCLDAGGSDVAKSIRTQLARLPLTPELERVPTSVDSEKSIAHGRPDSARLAVLHRSTRADVVDRTLTMLDAHVCGARERTAHELRT